MSDQMMQELINAINKLGTNNAFQGEHEMGAIELLVVELKEIKSAINGLTEAIENQGV